MHRGLISSFTKTIDTTPQSVDLIIYAGDTLSLRVNVLNQPWAAPVWSAHIRANRLDSPVLGEFTILPDATGAWLILPAAVASGLVPVEADHFVGEWDVQVTDVDIVQTLVQGSIRIEADVTKPVGP